MENVLISWLIAEMKISQEILEETEKISTEKRQPLVVQLIEMGALSEKELMRGLREVTLFRVLSNELDSIPIGITRIVPQEIITRHYVIPYAIYGERLELAMLDPTDQSTIDIIKRETELKPFPAIATLTQIQMALSSLYPQKKADDVSPAHSLMDHRVTRVEKRAFLSEAPQLLPFEVPEKSLTPISEIGILNGNLTLTEVRNKSLTARTKEDIAQSALSYLRQFYHKGGLFIVQGEIVIGWHGFGGAFERGAIAQIKLELGTPSIFQRVSMSRSPYVGGLFTSEINNSFAKMLQDFPPKKVALYPLILHEKIFALLYLELGAEEDRMKGEIPELCSIISEGFGQLIARNREAKAA